MPHIPLGSPQPILSTLRRAYLNKDHVNTTHHIPDASRNSEASRPASECIYSGSDSHEVSSEPDSIFSYGSAKSSVSSASTTATVSSVIREILRLLLSTSELNMLFETIAHRIKPVKARNHIKGFLKSYGADLEAEAGHFESHIQAARFVQRYSYHIAGAILAQFHNSHELSLQISSETRPDRETVENWLNHIDVLDRKEATQVIPDQASEKLDSDDDETADELLPKLEFPRMELVENFMLKSYALKEVIRSIRDWLGLVDHHHGSGHTVSAPEEESPENLTETLIEQECFKMNTDISVAEETSDKAKPISDEIGPTRNEIGLISNEMERTAGKVDLCDFKAGLPSSGNDLSTPLELRIGPDDRRASDIQEDNPHDETCKQDYNTHGPPVSAVSMKQDMLSHLLQKVTQMLSPRIPPGHERIHWRCVCGGNLSAVFGSADSEALEYLKYELKNPAQCVPQQPPSSSHSKGKSKVSQSPATSYHLKSISLSSSKSQPPHDPFNERGNIPTPSSALSCIRPHVIDIVETPKFFELCVNIGNYAIEHHEINISDVVSDSHLFKRIWDKYNYTRWTRIWRRIFFQPRTIHFVMFHVTRQKSYGAGIHEKPNVFPPHTELTEKRYHYECPKLLMPVNVFMHFLSLAGSSKGEKHCGDTWLRRLPKKLNESILASGQRHFPSDDSDNHFADPDLAFGWGVHIIDGPNHTMLALLMCIGVMISFVISGLVVGLAKTQEQGFGIGSFILSIVVSGMTVIYFWIQQNEA